MFGIGATPPSPHPPARRAAHARSPVPGHASPVIASAHAENRLEDERFLR